MKKKRITIDDALRDAVRSQRKRDRAATIRRASEIREIIKKQFPIPTPPPPGTLPGQHLLCTTPRLETRTERMLTGMGADPRRVLGLLRPLALAVAFTRTCDTMAPAERKAAGGLNKRLKQIDSLMRYVERGPLDPGRVIQDELMAHRIAVMEHKKALGTQAGRFSTAIRKQSPIADWTPGKARKARSLAAFTRAVKALEEYLKRFARDKKDMNATIAAIIEREFEGHALKPDTPEKVKATLSRPH